MNDAATAPASTRMAILPRLGWILSLQSVLLVILVYPMRLKDAWLQEILSDWHQRARAGDPYARFWLDQWDSIISFTHSPLILKGAVAAVCAIAAILVFAAGFLVDPSARRARPDGGRRLSLEFACFGAFLLFAAWSALWSPTAALSAEGIPWVAMIGGLGFVLLRRGVSLDEMRQLAVLLISLGAVVAIISLMEATAIADGFVFNFMVHFSDPRNAFGSLLGHNNSVASYLMMTCFPAFAFGVDGRTLPRRLAAWSYLALALLTVLVVQSRAIWGIGALLGAAFIAVAFRQRGRAFPWRLAVYPAFILALGVGSQLVDRPWNPFLIKSKVSFRERLSHLSARQLRLSTQWRMIVASGSLIAERPLIGHGLYAFQYKIPKAQADYYAGHPGHSLGYTMARSNMAHNEYLQVLVEQGLVGLALLALAFGELAWRGRRVARTLSGPPQLLHTAMGFAALGIALHAIVDFPFHVPHLALPWLLVLPCYAALRRDPDPPALLSAPEAAIAEPKPSLLRSDRMGRLVAALFIVALLPMIAYPFARAYQADIEYMHGDSYRNALSDGRPIPPEARESYKNEAERHLRRAIALQGSHDLARQRLADILLFRAIDMAAEERRVPGGVPSYNGPAARFAFQAIELIQDSMAGLKYHAQYLQLAQCYQFLGNIADPRDRPAYMKLQRDCLETTLHYCPHYPDAAYQLDLLLRQTPGSEKRIDELRRMIKESFPEFFFRRYVMAFNQDFAEKDYASAIAGSEALLRVASENPLNVSFAIDVNMWGGDQARVLGLIQRFREMKYDPKRWKVHPIWTTFSGVYEGIILGHWDAVLRELDRHGPSDPWTRARLAGLEAYARERTGANAALPSRFPRPAEISPEDWNLMVAEQRPIFLARWVRDAAAAKAAFEARLALSEKNPRIDFWLDYAYLARDLQDADLLRQCLTRIEATDPRFFALRNRNHPLLRPLEPPQK